MFVFVVVSFEGAVYLILLACTVTLFLGELVPLNFMKKTLMQLEDDKNDSMVSLKHGFTQSGIWQPVGLKQAAARKTCIDFVTKPQSEPALVTTRSALCNQAWLFGQCG